MKVSKAPIENRLIQKERFSVDKIRYYKFDIGDGLMRRTGAKIEYLDTTGKWIEDRNLIRKFIGGDTDFDKVTEEEAKLIVQNRMYNLDKTRRQPK